MWVPFSDPTVVLIGGFFMYTVQTVRQDTKLRLYAQGINLASIVNDRRKASRILQLFADGHKAARNLFDVLPTPESEVRARMYLRQYTACTKAKSSRGIPSFGADMRIVVNPNRQPN